MEETTAEVAEDFALSILAAPLGWVSFIVYMCVNEQPLGTGRKPMSTRAALCARRMRLWTFPTER